MHQIELYFVVFTSFLCCHVVTCPFLLWAASTLAVWLFGLTLMLCFLLCIKVEYIKK